jgi:PAS domain S-box-containing protein
MSGEKPMETSGKILVVDDNSANLHLLTDLLTQQGYRVYPATEGQLALRFAQSTPPDLILLDIVMPEMDGFHVCQQLKADQRTHEIPVIFMTALSEMPDKVTGFKLGAVDYITKPFQADEVLARIRTHLTLHGLKRRLETQNQQLQQEIAERRQVEAALQSAHDELERRVRERTADLAKANRMLNILSACIESVMRAAEESTLLQEICRIIVEIGGYSLVWIGYAEQDADCTVRPVAQAGFEDGYLDTLGITWAEGERGQGPTGTAIRTSKPCIASDIQTDPQFAPWRKEAIRRGYASSIALPLKFGGRVFGALNIYAAEPDAFHDEEVRLLMELADDLAFGLSSLREREARWRAEEALRGSEEKYRTVADFTYDWEYWQGPDGRYLYVSPSCERITGYRAEEFLQDPGLLDRIIHPDDRELVVGKSGQHEPHDGVQAASCALDFRVITRNQEPRWISHCCQPVFGYKGQYMGLRGSNRDITERRNAEEQREKLQTQLIQAQRMELVGRLAGGVAHDFNNILAVILGHAQLALMKLESSNPLRPTMEEIEKAARRSADLTRQLLAFARHQTISPLVLDINQTVSALLTLLRRLIGEDIELIFRPSEQLWSVKMDPSQIDQVLTNLCVNARDAIGGVGRITIETSNIAFDEVAGISQPGFAPGEYVLLSVCDDGCGMEEEVQQHLFEPFFTTKGIGQGTGLGLATVYGIVKQNDGFIHVISEPGKGSTIQIYLPGHARGKAEAVRRDVVADHQVVPGKETVLLVEDQLELLSLCRAILENLGYRVLSAGSARNALQLAATHGADIHLLVTDVVMPEMNGPDLAKRLHEAYPKLKCLFMSGYTADIIAHKGILEKGIAYIQKPFSVSQLAAKVSQVLGEQKTS